MLRGSGPTPTHEPEGGTPDELKRIIAQSQTGGQLDAGEADMLTGVFHLHEQEARQVMTPIPAVVTVDSCKPSARRSTLRVDRPLAAVVTEDENQDRVKGIVHVNQLVKLLMAGGGATHFAGLSARHRSSRRRSRSTTCSPTSSASAPSSRS